MNDFERRLRDAMAAAADGAPPPGLMEGIRRRHRRHLIRVGAGCVAVVAVLALIAPPVAHALRSAPGGTGPAGHGPGTVQPCPSVPASKGCAWYTGSGTPPPPSSVRAAAGTVLRDCQSANATAADIPGYQRQSVRAGAVWFVGAREKGSWPVSRWTSHRQLGAVGAIMAVRPGATVVVRVGASARWRFRFLSGFNNTNQYSPGAGEPGLTFADCGGPGLAVFWVGYLNNGLPCVPFEVSQPGHRPIRVTLSANGGTCAA